MKIVCSVDTPAFHAYRITVHIESHEDENVLRALFARNEIVPKAIEEERCGMQAFGVRPEQISRFMLQMWEAIQKH